jgi:Holliday junction DNA helicase RuvA
MIGQLHGRVLSIDPPWLVLDVQGVGYEIECPISTLCELPAVGQEVTLLTHFVVRDDAQLLYGFLRAEDRASFRVLIRISGVGPKLAIAILSGLSGGALADAVARDDVATLTKLPGIGKKTAERLIVELRDKLAADATAPQTAAVGSPLEDAILGLVALGYKESDARKAVQQLPADSGASPESLIRASLQSMLRH